MNGIAELVRLIEEASGNVIAEREHQRLLELAESRVRATGQRDLASYIRLLRLDLNGSEWRHLLSRITINESFLFRAPQQFRAVAEAAIPDLTSRRLPGSCLRIWSAGCARGEEAVTVAIVCAESPHLAGWSWQILATDVDEAALEDARLGRFGRRAVARVPDDLMQRYFTPRGTEYELDPCLRNRIEFRPLNLVKPPGCVGGGCGGGGGSVSGGWSANWSLGIEPDSFDIVFLRNVLIYFRTEVQRSVVAAVAEVLVDDGYLFLGPSESLWQLSTELVAVDLGDCFCYRHCSAQPAEAAGQEEGHGQRKAQAVAVTEHGEEKNPLLQSLSSRRVGAGAADDSTTAADSALAPAAPMADEVTLRTRVLIPIVEALVQGQIEQAQSLIREGTERFPENAVLRALEGLAFDVQKLTDPALKAYRASLYLDGSLYQIRFLLARCMERLGWHERALREYREVLAALASDEARELEDWAVLGLPSRAQVETGCSKVLSR